MWFHGELFGACCGKIFSSSGRSNTRRTGCGPHAHIELHSNSNPLLLCLNFGEFLSTCRPSLCFSVNERIGIGAKSGDPIKTRLRVVRPPPPQDDDDDDDGRPRTLPLSSLKGTCTHARTHVGTHIHSELLFERRAALPSRRTQYPLPG